MSRDRLIAAAVQLSSQDHLEENLGACRELVLRAAKLGAELVVLPENFAYFGPDEGRRAIAERIGDAGPIQAALGAAAREGKCWIVGGGMPEASGDPARPHNTALVVSPNGDVAARYRKVHLFDVELPDGQKLAESATTLAGSEPIVVDAAGFRVGLSICYDLRFPELYRALVTAGAEVLVIPSAFTLQTGKDHWNVLVRARAIESQAWVIAAGQWGKHPRNRQCWGHSMIVDPWGIVVAEASDRVGVVVAEIDRAHLERVRTQLPCLQHRRL